MGECSSLFYHYDSIICIRPFFLVITSLERKIFDCFMKGYKSKEIAELLNIDIRCVYNAKYRLQKKMDKSK